MSHAPASIIPHAIGTRRWADLQRPHDRWRIGLVAIAGGGILLPVLAFAPRTAVPLALLAAGLALALVKPPLGLLALPLSIPWGAEATVATAMGHVSLSDAIVAGLVLGWAVRGLPFPSIDRRVKPWLLATALLLLTMLISIAVAASPSLSLRELVKWSEVLGVAAMCPVFLRSRGALGLMTASLAVGGTSEALLGIGQFLSHSGPRSFHIYGHFMRAYGSFGQPNPYAGYLNILIVLCLATAWTKKVPTLWAASGLMAIGSIVAFSRAGWIAGLTGITLVGAYSSGGLRKVLGGFLVSLSLLAVAGSFSLIPVNPLERLASSFGVGPVNFRHVPRAQFSEVERAAHWVAGLRMFQAHPLLGVGIGNYPAAYPLYHVGHFTHALGHAHDYYINVAAETGILGLLAYSLFFTAGVWAAMVLSKKAALGSWTRAAGVGAVAAWATIAVHNLFDVLYVHEIQLVIALAMGMLAAAALQDVRKRPRYHTRDVAPVGLLAEPLTLNHWNARSES